MKYDPHIKHLYRYYLLNNPNFFGPEFLIDCALKHWSMHSRKHWIALAEIKYKRDG